MLKKFSYKVPNEMYIDNFSENKTMSWTYDGPETFTVEVDVIGGSILRIVDEITELSEDALTQYITVDATQLPEVAYWISQSKINHDYKYEDEINFDGSIYQKITNPRLNDLYRLTYVNSEWKFDLITRDPETMLERKIKENLDLVESKLSQYDLGNELQPVYDKFIKDCKDYLKTLETVYPWKHISIDESGIPKIPFQLINVINTIKNISGV